MKISVIIPFFNEEGNVDFVLREVREVLATLNVNFEIVVIDDGSNDATGSLLKKASEQIAELRVIAHPRNYGQSAGLWSGFQIATGDVIITMDGDGQADFHDIPRMLDFLPQYTAVFGQRVKRHDPLHKLIATQVAFILRRFVLGDDFRDTSGPLKVMKREVLQYLIPIRNFHCFIPFLFKQAGVSYIAVDINHRPRIWGKTKYCLTKFYFLAMATDLLFMWWYRKRNILKDILPNMERIK